MAKVSGVRRLDGITVAPDLVHGGYHWGAYSSAATLPNVEADAEEVREGDLANVGDILYKCEDPTSGSATWTEVGSDPSSVTSAGAISGTTITATTGDVTATLGDVVSSAGAVSAATTVTAGTGVTATTGGLTATAGDITAAADDIVATLGDIDAVGGHRSIVGPFKATLAAGQNDTDVPHVGVAVAFQTFRAGSITAMRANLDSAVTGASQDVRVYATIGGTQVAASELTLSQAGAEVTAVYTAAKDTSLHTFTAGQALTVEYDSDTITNTPELEVWLEIEQ